ncbi:hypothetical protein ACB092_06G130400 [Castanea dentata]
MHRGANNHGLTFILDRVKQKLAGWKANLLSLAGRAVLIQASTSTIPAYVMQCTALPEKLLNNIDRVNRNFLWGSTETSKKTHCKVLRSKYYSQRRLGAKDRDKLPCSRTWKAMRMETEVFKKGIRPFAVEEEQLQVRDVLRTDGWDWSDISLQIPEVILMEIRAIPYSITAPNVGDRLVWNCENKGDFDLKSAYNLAMGFKDEADKFTGGGYGNIGVGEYLVRKCLKDSDVCPMCNRELETIIHRLKDCSASRDIWFKMGINPSNRFYEDNLLLWLEMNCKDGSHKVRHHPPWKIVFPFAIWCIWKGRNNFVFWNRSVQSNIHHDIIFRASEFQHCILNANRLGSKTVVRVRWETPQVGWVWLNTDGSAAGNPGRVGRGGILQDDQGRWIASFSRNIGLSTSFMAELWTLCDGLSLCHNLNYSAVDIQIDAKTIVGLLSKPFYSNSFVMPIIDDCRQLISQIPQVRIGHYYREANSCADFLAKIGSVQTFWPK